MFQCFGYRSQVAHPVIYNGNRVHVYISGCGCFYLQHTLGGWNDVVTARINRYSHAQRATEGFKNGFGLVMCIFTGKVIYVQCHHGMVDEALKNSWIRSTSNEPIVARVNTVLNCKPGLPDKSITTLVSASSRGT